MSDEHFVTDLVECPRCTATYEVEVDISEEVHAAFQLAVKLTKAACLNAARIDRTDHHVVDGIRRRINAVEVQDAQPE
ncbi:unnamed protein product [marine sediment metagenome]|uniref:Uncharacterized protein n=1 Tax=marine sediment metagenome TaxID=412755 RepID=X0RWA1_9ZZZZ